MGSGGVGQGPRSGRTAGGGGADLLSKLGAPPILERSPRTHVMLGFDTTEQG